VLNNDLIVMFFEGVGAIIAWMNVFQYIKDREVKGISWPMTGFYIAWGVWNIFFFADLHYWFALSAGIVLLIGNIIWLYLVIRDKLKG